MSANPKYPDARRLRGVTLVELLVVLVLAALLMAPLASMLSITASSSAVVANQMELQTQAQFAVRRIVQQIQQSSTAPVVNSSTSTTLGSATYDLAAGKVAGTFQLGETLSGNKRFVLAEPVSSFSLATVAPSSAQAQGLVEVALTMTQNDAQATLREVSRLGGAR